MCASTIHLRKYAIRFDREMTLTLMLPYEYVSI